MIRKSILALFALTLLSVTFAVSGEPEPKHLADAKSLVKQLDLKNNSYVFGGNTLTWTPAVTAHCDCSGFINGLLMHSYGWSKDDLKKVIGAARPTAARYHNKIVAEANFTHIKHVKDAQPGDIVAVKYPAGKKATGHVMLAAGPAKQMNASEPLVEGTTQWEIAVIDSAGSGHGPTDTRHAKGQNGKDKDGIGLGILRIYADKDGHVAGYSWSTLASSRFLNPQYGHLVIGRLKPNVKP